MTYIITGNPGPLYLASSRSSPTFAPGALWPIDNLTPLTRAIEKSLRRHLQKTNPSYKSLMLQFYGSRTSTAST